MVVCMKERAIMFQNRLLHWAKDNLRDFPWRSTNDPYKICIAEILLHQTFARKVVPAYEVFIKSYPDVKKLHNARIRSIEKIIYPLGFLYRAKKLKDFAKTVVNEYGGRVPHYKEELLALPGVGEYTSSAVLCFAYDEQIPIIDANVIRVYSRVFGIEAKLPTSLPNKAIKEIAEDALPLGKAKIFNYGILDFASMVCSHYKPKCLDCVANKECNKFNQGSIAS